MGSMTNSRFWLVGIGNRWAVIEYEAEMLRLTSRGNYEAQGPFVPEARVIEETASLRDALSEMIAVSYCEGELTPERRDELEALATVDSDRP